MAADCGTVKHGQAGGNAPGIPGLGTGFQSGETRWRDESWTSPRSVSRPRQQTFSAGRPAWLHRLAARFSPENPDRMSAARPRIRMWLPQGKRNDHNLATLARAWRHDWRHDGCGDCAVRATRSRPGSPALATSPGSSFRSARWHGRSDCADGAARAAATARHHHHRREQAGRLRQHRRRAGRESSPDGSNWVFVFDTHAVNPFLQNLSFDTEKDLEPVLLIGTAPNVVATHPGRPFKTFADVIAAAKAKPDSITYGSIGSGSLGHLTMVLLGQRAGVKMVHVPYRGGGPLMNDALAGHVDLAIGSAALVTPQVSGGKLRGLAQTSARRVPGLPDVPTVIESGFPGFEFIRLVGLVHGRGHASCHCRQVQQCAGGDAARARHQRPHRGHADHAAGRRAGRAAPIPGGSDEALGAGGERAQHQGRRLTSRTDCRHH